MEYKQFSTICFLVYTISCENQDLSRGVDDQIQQTLLLTFAHQELQYLLKTIERKKKFVVSTVLPQKVIHVWISYFLYLDGLYSALLLYYDDGRWPL